MNLGILDSVSRNLIIRYTVLAFYMRLQLLLGVCKGNVLIPYYFFTSIPFERNNLKKQNADL